MRDGRILPATLIKGSRSRHFKIAGMNPSAADSREKLRQILKTHSLKFGDFTLASGRKSNFYFDSKLTTLRADGAFYTGECFLDLLAMHGVAADCFGGLSLGADPIAAAVAAASHRRGGALRGFIVRKDAKEHGSGKRIEGPVSAGERAVIVDDVVTTAGSTLKAIAAAQEFGLQIVAVVAIVDRSPPWRHRGQRAWSQLSHARSPRR